VSTRALEALDRVLNRSEDADDALRDTVALLADEPGIDWAGIAFMDEGVLTLGPSAGTADAERRVCVPVTYQGEPVGELWVDGDADPSFLARVATLISAHVLIGWDMGGEAWEA
jgi:putative methionine-R-sulfoxide reductase with GAF domain